ncbi:uncharacterized protein BYT42DRAFT_556335 [Radiomyces spectabilis]|uniref:uncharacterized protein n=1 Tax=Radiomyces spectabilis TaxID=64574 RepID=UPI00222073AB|nr:uncharacterized protein BYT42DRAFT_556335 [Radiomyces spectabilis]KAI8391292.1 hypothetical protein BYT42DRAFT_556335 [Radiomyces spectabilis]
MAVSSSKAFPRSQPWQRSERVIDVLLPKYYEYDMLDDPGHGNFSFRSTTTNPQSQTMTMDDELCMGDDCDALYTETLLNSDFMDWLYNEHSPSTSSTSLERLRMLVAHVSQAILPPLTKIQEPPLISQNTTPSFRSSTSTTTSSSSSSSSSSISPASISSPPNTTTTVHLPGSRSNKGKRKA